MGSQLIRLKVLPSDAGLDINQMLESIKDSLPKNMVVRRFGEEPIAFGLVALIIDVQTEDKEGTLDSLEDAIHSSKFVGEVEVLGMSRLSTDLK